MTRHPAAEATAGAYREAVADLWGGLGIWDYLRYDEAGELWLNDLRVIDAVRRFGSPLEIVDTTIVERRCREWAALTRKVAQSVGYSGRMDYLYAAKANMASEVAHAAYRSGWGAETSSVQDMRHLEWLEGHGLLPEGIRVVCNGFKLPSRLYGWPRSEATGTASSITLPPDNLSEKLRPSSYCEAILEAARRGRRITPILDEGELEAFARPDTPRMDVGLRLRCGRVRSLADLDRVVSRFGMDRHAVAATAADISRLPHLTLTTLHSMVGAAETIPVDVFATSLLVAAEVWRDLRHAHPTLTELNLGGGVPPLGEDYDHRGFLTRLMAGLLEISRDSGVPPPDLTFELGSLVAAEGGFHVLRVLQLKDNAAADGAATRWAILDGGLMAAIPDMLLIGKPFRFLAVSGADRPAEPVVFGDPSCDSDGRYPPAAFGPERAALLPVGSEGQHVVIQGVGAYQEILAGVRGAHHCGLLEAIELVLEPSADGTVAARVLPRQTTADAAALLGYEAASVGPLAAAMGAPRDRLAEA